MASNMGLWGGLNCLFGLHVRSRGQARARAEGWTTRCSRCGIPMARAHGGKWQVIKRPDPDAEEDLAAARKLAFADAITRSRRAGFRAKRKQRAKDGDGPVVALVATEAPEADADPVVRKRLFGLFARRWRPEAGATVDVAELAVAGQPPERARRATPTRKRKRAPGAAAQLAADAAPSQGEKPPRRRSTTPAAKAKASQAGQISTADDLVPTPAPKRARRARIEKDVTTAE